MRYQAALRPECFNLTSLMATCQPVSCAAIASRTSRPAMTPSESAQLKNRIRRLRFDHGEMTQQELADRVGAARQTIIALEAGKYAPSLLLAFRLARVFGVTTEDVFQWDGD